MYSRFDHQWPVMPQQQPDEPQRSRREPSALAIALLAALVVVLIVIATLVYTPA